MPWNPNTPGATSQQDNAESPVPPTPTPFIRKFVSGRYYTTQSGGATGGTPTLNEMHGTPFWVPVKTTFDRASIAVTAAGAAGSVVRYGLYNSDASYLPSTLNVEWGAKDATTTGLKEFLGLTLTLDVGLYWFAAVVQVATCSVNCHVGTAQPEVAMESFLGSGSGSSACYYRSSITGALPATWGATTAGGGSPIRVGLRAA